MVLLEKIFDLVRKKDCFQSGNDRKQSFKQKENIEILRFPVVVKIDMLDDFLVKHRLRRREEEVFDFREALACARMKQSAP